MTEEDEIDRSAHKGKGGTGHPAAQFALSSDLVDQLGDSTRDYARALWSVAQRRGLDADEMTELITQVNNEFGVRHPETVLDRMQEIFRNSGGFITIINEEHVLAGAMSDADAYESPHAANAPDEFTDTAG